MDIKIKELQAQAVEEFMEVLLIECREGSEEDSDEYRRAFMEYYVGKLRREL